jgi:uncharacterized membrane protein YeaQ/YmgE (transglycosylase-associated protein family)
MLSNLLVAVILGALVGVVARMLVRSPVKGGCATNIAIGIIGAVIGSILFRSIGGVGVRGLDLYSFLVALVGAVVFLVGARALSGR